MSDYKRFCRSTYMSESTEYESPLPTYHCYLEDWNQVHLTKEKVSAWEDTDDCIVYLGTLDMLHLGIQHGYGSEADVARLFTGEDTPAFYHAVVVDLLEYAIVPRTFMSFPSDELRNAALQGAGWIEELTGNDWILLPIDLYRGEDEPSA